MKRWWIVAATATVALLVAGVVVERGAPSEREHPLAVTRIGLTRFDSCSSHLEWLKGAALERVGPYGLLGGVRTDMGAGSAAESSRDIATTTAPAASDGATAAGPDGATAAGPEAGTVDGYGTNVQEAGVDEADGTKSDGRRILTIRGSSLAVVAIDGPTPTLTASIDLGLAGGQMLVDGDRVIAWGQPLRASADVPPSAVAPIPPDGSGGSSSDVMESPMGGVWPTTDIVEVDLARTSIVGRRTIEGTITAGRSNAGTFRLVVSSPSDVDLGFVYPQGPQGEDAATALNRSIIERSSIEDWEPTITDEQGGVRPLVECGAMYHPADFSGFATLAVLSVADGLDSMTSTGVVADAEVTYASAQHLYVATGHTDGLDPSDPARGSASVVTSGTDIHRFDLAAPTSARYEGSGRIEGRVLNQYSLSESDGDLRVATTTDRFSADPMPVPEPVSPTAEPTTTVVEPMPSDPATGSAVPPSRTSGITVLRLQGSELVTIGRLDGLGPTEQIQAVRFMGERAYVVTFLVTDPLYVIDLTDPTAPRALGELHVNGFSNYLHPVGDHRMLGVGIDADDRGRTRGALVSLYDTSDPAHPRELGRLTFANRQFDAGQDPHAVTWDPDAGVVTLASSGWGEPFGAGGPDRDFIGFSVRDDHLAEVGRIPAGAASDSPMILPGSNGSVRTLVAVDRLWAITDARVSGHERTTLAELASLDW